MLWRDTRCCPRLSCRLLVCRYLQPHSNNRNARRHWSCCLEGGHITDKDRKSLMECCSLKCYLANLIEVVLNWNENWWKGLQKHGCLELGMFGQRRQLHLLLCKNLLEAWNRAWQRWTVWLCLWRNLKQRHFKGKETPEVFLIFTQVKIEMEQQL